MKQDCHILIVDDNKSILTALKILLNSVFTEITVVNTPNRIPEVIRSQTIDIVLLDMNFHAGLNTGNEGLYWLQEILKLNKDISVVMMTAYGDVQLAVDALKLGALDFVVKPWENAKLIATLRSACKLKKATAELKGLKQKHTRLKDELIGESKHIIGSSPAIMNVLATIRKVAATDANVLLTGENGTGKELFAKELHRLSMRQNEVMVTVDMGAVSETLFESELFGHKKGAFTDAKEDRAGKFEIADKGTLFLDEIGNLSLGLQAKMLVALQSRQITRVGDNTPLPFDVRLICATNQLLEESIGKGQFREDLLYRINTIQIEIPPLRQRGADIISIATFYLSKYAEKYGKGNLQISDAAKQQLLKYPWPGNVRELQHCMEKATILSDRTVLEPEDFYLKSVPTSMQITSAPSTIDEMESAMIRSAVERHAGNMTATAQELGITRQTLYNKMKKYGL